MTILEEVEQRGIQRVCHATHFDNLRSIADHGLLSRNALAQAGIGAVINDPERHDGHLDFISCSIEVPNAYYMRSVAPDSDWVILRMDPVVLTRDSTRFSSVNAARGSGSSIGAGVEVFRELYAESSDGWNRYTTHASSCPTNFQAEVLVKRKVRVNRFREVLVRTEADVEAHGSLLRRFEQMTGANTRISPGTFDPDTVRDTVRAGRIPRARRVEW